MKYEWLNDIITSMRRVKDPRINFAVTKKTIRKLRRSVFSFNFLTLFVLLVFLTLFSSLVFSASIEIFSPKDKSLTFKNNELLKGSVQGISQLNINNIPVDLGPGGSFNVRLFFNPGKNLAQLVGKTEAGQEIKADLRILHLLSFDDIENRVYFGKRHWARQAVNYLSTLGIIEGYPDGNFYPQAWLQRGEFATWLARAKGLTLEAVTKDLFFDVPKEHWRAPYIQAVIKAGLMKEVTYNTFGIFDGMKRADVAEIIVQAEVFPTPKVIGKTFIDVPFGQDFAEYVDAAARKGVVQGISSKKPVFSPGRLMTRAEAAVLFARVPTIKKKITYLFDYAKGYDASAFCEVNTAPEITWFSIDPAIVKVGQAVELVIKARIREPQGFFDITKVVADLTPLNGPSNAILEDIGEGIDEQPQDGVYSLKIKITPNDPGLKRIFLRVLDRGLWYVEKQVIVTVSN